MLPSVFGENLFDEFFGDSFEKRFFGGNDPLYGKHAKNLMKTDVRETENQYELSVDLPGFKKDEIQVELQDGYLTEPYVSGNETSVSENGHSFLVDWATGQKTGFFLDQRDNRALVGQYAAGRRVLNLFCYTGGFSIYALNGGAASVVSVDSSAVAVNMLRRNVKLNTGNEDASGRHSAVCSDAMEYLRDIPAGYFDLMVVDPPAFAKHRDVLDNAMRAYRRLNAAAIGKIAQGGLLFTYSCSQAVDRKSFELAVFTAAAQTGRPVRILRRLTQPADHPVNIYHPEGAYLKGLLLYVE